MAKITGSDYFCPISKNLPLHVTFVLFQGPLVGMNPVQIRATVDLYPSSRPSAGGVVHGPEAPTGWSHD